MSRNISQIYTDNPSTNAAGADLFYKGNTPYGLGSDSAIQFSDLQISLFGTNRPTAYSVFGLGNGTQLTLTDSNFTGGQYQLTNPCPNTIVLNCSTTGNSLLFPSAQGSDAFGLYQGPRIINEGTQRVNTASFLGIPQTPSLPGDDNTYELTDNSTAGGTWSVKGNVTGILGNTGNVELIAGTNISITNNNNGSITLAASGSSSSAVAIQGTFTSSTLTTNTPVTPTSGDVPIAVESGGFTVTHSSGTNVILSTIAGVQTAIIQNDSTAGRWCSVEFDLTMSVATSAGGTYTFTVYTNTGATLNFKKVTVPTTVPSSIPVSICSPMVFLNQNDYVYLRVSGTLSPAVSNFIATYFNGKLVDTTIAGIPNTDALPQGSSNLYLSQNGGSTYQNVSATPVVVGNVAAFSTVGGQISDSGLLVGEANTVATLQTSTNSSFFPLFVSSSTNSYQQPRLSTGLTYNPSTNSMSLGSVNLGNLSSASVLVAVDSGKTTTAGIGFYTLGGLTFNNGGGPLLSTTAPVVLSSILSDGDYISLGGSGRNIGVTSSGSSFFSYNLDWNGNTATYVFDANGSGITLESSSTGINIKGAIGGTGGSNVTPSNVVSFNADGTVLINSASTASSLIATNTSGFLTAVPNLGFTSSVTVTGSTQTMALATIYINNYSGGQTAYTLPAATGSSKAIMLLSLTTSSTSGWQISAVGSDQIQYMRSLSATKGTLTSSSGSAADCVTLIDVAAGLWLVYPSSGLDLTVV